MMNSKRGMRLCLYSEGRVAIRFHSPLHCAAANSAQITTGIPVANRLKNWTVQTVKSMLVCFGMRQAQMLVDKAGFNLHARNIASM